MTRRKVVSRELQNSVILQTNKNQKTVKTHLGVYLLLMLCAHGDRMAISTDTSVLVSRIVLAWCLALEHLAVLWDAVALALGNRVLAVDGLAFSRGPCEVVTADLNVVVGELAELVVVHAEKFSLFGCAELETRDLVDTVGENGADNERVRGAGNDVSDLLVDRGGSTGDGTTLKTVVDTVESDDVVGTEDAVEEKTPHSSDAVLSEHIERIVDLDPELDCDIVRFSFENG